MIANVRSLAALTAALVLTSASLAQAPASAGTTPGTGLVPVPLAAPATPGVDTPLPAECLGQTGGGPWLVAAPYIWIFGIEGTVGIGHRTAVVDATVSDAIDQLDNLRGAAMLHLEAGYGNVGAIVDLTYLYLVPVDGLITVETRTTLLEVLGVYRFADTGRRKGGITFDALAGVRYYNFTNSIRGNVFELFNVERTNDWVDLVVGLRTGAMLKDDLGVFIRADAGGFGIGESSDKACNLIVGFEYQCCESGSLWAGYRWLSIDRDEGRGPSRSDLDVTIAGPFVAFGLRY
jgi:hypothetical protein